MFKLKKIWKNIENAIKISQIFNEESPVPANEYKRGLKKSVKRYGNFIHLETDKFDNSSGVQPGQIRSLQEEREDYLEFLKIAARFLNRMEREGAFASITEDGFVYWDKVFSDLSYLRYDIVEFYIASNNDLKRLKISKEVREALYNGSISIDFAVQVAKTKERTLSLDDLDRDEFNKKRASLWKDIRGFVPKSEWLLRANPENFSQELMKHISKIKGSIATLEESEQLKIALMVDNYGINLTLTEDFEGLGLYFNNPKVEDYRSLLGKTGFDGNLIKALSLYPALRDYIKSISHYNDGNRELINYAAKMMIDAKKNNLHQTLAEVDPRSLRPLREYVHGFIEVSKLLSYYSRRSKDLTIPLVEGSVNKYKYQITKKDDPIGLTIGYATDCCMVIGNSGESCIRAGYEYKNSSFFTVMKNGKVYAQSWVWATDDIFCFDSVEVLGNDLDSYKDVLLAYQEAAKELSKTYKTVICGADGNRMPKGLKKIGEFYSKEQLAEKRIHCPFICVYSDLHRHEGGAILMKGEL